MRFPTNMNRTARRIASCIGAGLALCGPMHAAQANAQAWPALADAAPEPSTDAFYRSPSADELNAAKPGEILRYRSMNAKAYFVMPVQGQAWQLMYRTTDHTGKAVAAVTAALVPANAPSQPADRKLFVYNAAYDALTLKCAPSYETAKGTDYEQLFVQQGLAKGWVTLLPDYEGLQSYWALGRADGRAAIDAVRAAEAFAPLNLNGTATPAAMLGYSGGSVPTTWTNEMYPTYAPELNFVGFSAGGIPVDLGNVARSVDGTLFAGLYVGAVTSMARAYPEVDVRSLANDKGVAAMAKANDMCAGQFLAGVPDVVSAFAFHHMSEYTSVPDLLKVPAIERIMAENRLGQQVPGAPIYLFNGNVDQVMPIQDVRALKDRYCAQGVKVKLTEFAGAGHIMTQIQGFSSGLAYITDRMNGKPAPTSCQ